jgi:hypothetical protein
LFSRNCVSFGMSLHWPFFLVALWSSAIFLTMLLLYNWHGVVREITMHTPSYRFYPFLEPNSLPLIRRGLISLWLYKENKKQRDWNNIFTLHIPPWAPHTYDFFVLTSLTDPRKILLAVLQIGKAKDLSAPLSMAYVCLFSTLLNFLTCWQNS